MSTDNKDIVYIDHYFADWNSDTKHMTPTQEGLYARLRSLYFCHAGKHNGSLTDDFQLLCFRVGATNSSEQADLALVLKDKFKKIGKTYRHAKWDKYISNIRFKMRKNGNANDNTSNAPCNASNDGCNADGNVTDNTADYHNVTHDIMTGAERTEKSRKLKALINQGVQADKSMNLDTIRTLYDTHFRASNADGNTGCHVADGTPCNASNDECNADGNVRNAQNPQNKSIPNTQESKQKNVCVTSQALHAPTHTNFSKNLKSIANWQMPSVDIINALLDKADFGRTLSPSELTAIFERFVNYNVSRELQGNFLATEQVRTDKLIDWIKREKPIFASHTPATDTSQTQHLLPKDIDPKSMIFVSGFYKPCFDGYTPEQSMQILKDYRYVNETSLEAYERIKQTGVANCKKHQVASHEFVAQLFANNSVLQRSKDQVSKRAST